MNATNPGTARARRAISIAPQHCTTSLPYRPDRKYRLTVQIAAAVIAPHGHAMSLVLRSMVARRAFLSAR
jgi:hypothetical protein